MTRPTEFLTLDDLLAAAAAVVDGEVVVRDLGLLDAAIARPQASVFGEDAYPTLVLKAAALLDSLVRNHALIDGNKRLGWVGCALFLAMNGFDLVAPEDDAYDMVISVADGSLTELSDVAGALARWIVPLDR